MFHDGRKGCWCDFSLAHHVQAPFLSATRPFSSKNQQRKQKRGMKTGVSRKMTCVSPTGGDKKNRGEYFWCQLSPELVKRILWCYWHTSYLCIFLSTLFKTTWMFHNYTFECLDINNYTLMRGKMSVCKKQTFSACRTFVAFIHPSPRFLTWTYRESWLVWFLRRAPQERELCTFYLNSPFSFSKRRAEAVSADIASPRP